MWSSWSSKLGYSAFLFSWHSLRENPVTSFRFVILFESSSETSGRLIKPTSGPRPIAFEVESNHSRTSFVVLLYKAFIFMKLSSPHHFQCIENLRLRERFHIGLLLIHHLHNSHIQDKFRPCHYLVNNNEIALIDTMLFEIQ